MKTAFLAIAVLATLAGAASAFDTAGNYRQYIDKATAATGVRAIQFAADNTFSAATLTYNPANDAISGANYDWVQYDHTLATCTTTVIATGGSVPVEVVDGVNVFAACFRFSTTSGDEGDTTTTVTFTGGSNPAFDYEIVYMEKPAGTCDLVTDATGGFQNAIPQPTVGIAFNEATRRIEFTVTLDYILGGATDSASMWYVDFYDFSSNDALLARSTGHTCSSVFERAFGTNDYRDWWSSAPHTSFTAADWQTAYLTYDTTATNNRWTSVADDCNTITLTSDYTIGELADPVVTTNCRNTGGTTGAIIPTEDNNIITYTGTLYLVAVHQPNTLDTAGDDEPATPGYATQRFEVPFQFDVATVINDFAAVAAERAFEVNIFDFDYVFGGLDNDGDSQVNIILETRTGMGSGALELSTGLSTTGEFTAPNGAHSPGAGAPGAFVTTPVTEVGCSSNPDGTCVQTWTATIPNNGNSNTQFQGTYTFNWADENGSPYTVTFTVDFDAADPEIDLGTLTIESEILFFTSQADFTDIASGDTNAVTTFTNGQTLYVRHTYLVSEGDRDNTNFAQDTVKMCWSTDFSSFRPTSCDAKPGVMEGEEIQNLVVSGAPGANDATILTANYDGAVWSHEATWDAGAHNANGVELSAQRMDIDGASRNYYFEFTSIVSLRTTRGEVATKSVVARADDSRGNIRGAGLTTSSSSASTSGGATSTTAAGSTSSSTVLAGAGIIGAAIVAAAVLLRGKSGSDGESEYDEEEGEMEATAVKA